MDLTKRYWVFYFGDWYPAGGLNDVVFTSDSLEEAKAYYDSCNTLPNKSLFDRVEGKELA